MSTKRTKLEIVNDILIAIQNKGGKIKPTHLLYKSNLSHQKMTEYLNELIKNESVKIEEKGSKRLYSITDKGIKFISEFKKMKEFSDSFGL